MKRGKKLLSLFLAAAIAVSGINFAGVFEVNAANAGTTVRTTTPSDADVITGDDGSAAVSADVGVLEDAIEKAEAKIADEDKVISGLEEMKTAIANAKKILGYITVSPEGSVTKGMIKEAIKALEAVVVVVSPDDGTELAGDAEKAALKKALDDAKAKLEAAEPDKDKYTTESWNALEDAIEAAQALYGNLVSPENGTSTVTKQQVKDAIGALNVTLVLKDGEVVKPSAEDWDALQEQLDIANQKRENDYTEGTWATFAAAKAQAQALVDNKEVVSGDGVVTKAAVVAATEALRDAIAGLELKPGVADKSELQAQIAKAEALTESEYTAESWAAMQEKLTAAKSVNENDNATQEQVDTATEELKTAIDNLVPAGTVTVNKTALKTAIDNAKAKKQAEYTAASWAAMQAKLTAAETVYNDAAATQEQVNKAADELNAAVAALVKVTTATVNKTALKAAIDAAGSLVQSKYTAASWSAFQTALNNAKAVYAKANATQAEVDSALAALNSAKAALKAAPVKVTKVTITNGKTVKIAAGKKVKLTATVAPKNASNKGVTWSISKKDKKYATLKGSTVTTKKAGAGKKVKITATAKDGSKKKATITISIMKNAVTKVTLKAKKTVKAGKKITVKATVKTNGKKANKTLAWSVDKKSAKFASVNKKGVVTVKKTAKKGLKIKVTAAATDGSNKKGTVTIKVTK